MRLPRFAWAGNVLSRVAYPPHREFEKRDKRMKRRRKAKSRTTTDPLHSTLRITTKLIPIQEPFLEKYLAEGRSERPWDEYLKSRLPRNKRCHVRLLDYRKRIDEVYHLCFEQSKPRKSRKILSDFVAYFPSVALSSPWLMPLMRQQSNNLELEHRRIGYANQLFRAFADGLETAAHQSRLLRSRKANTLSIARKFRKKIRADLSEFIRYGLGREQEKEADLAEQIRELTQTYPRLDRCAQTLKRHLTKGHAYKAAVLIAATVYDVSQRALERGPAELHLPR